MSNELIIDASGSEVVIALLNDRRLVELNREKTNSQFAVGDIYLGRVRKVMPGLNAAFVESLRLRFQNIALVGELRDKKETAESANVAKSRFLAAASVPSRHPAPNAALPTRLCRLCRAI